MERKKWCRTEKAAEMGCQAGMYRWYLCPEGVINIEELPNKWGLLYWDGKKIYAVKAPEPFYNTGIADMKILASILRREGFPQKIYNYRGLQSTIKPKTINNIPQKRNYKQKKNNG